jgi:hypothetical protein
VIGRFIKRIVGPEPDPAAEHMLAAARRGYAAGVRAGGREASARERELQSILDELKARGWFGCLAGVGACGACLPCRARRAAEGK